MLGDKEEICADDIDRLCYMEQVRKQNVVTFNLVLVFSMIFPACSVKNI